MDKEQLLDELDSSREKLLMAIADLPDEALTASGAWQDWSVADVLVNLTVWEAELITGIMRLDQGKRPDKLLAALKQADTYDQRRYAENKGRDLDRVFADWQQARVQLEDWLETWPLRQLTGRKQYRWLGGKSLWQLIKEVLIAREKRFLPHLQLFAQRWQAEMALPDHTEEE